MLVRLGSQRIDVLDKFISFHVLYVCGGAVLEAAHISDVSVKYQQLFAMCVSGCRHILGSEAGPHPYYDFILYDAACLI